MDRETIRKSAIVESQWKQRALRLAGGLEIPWRRWPEKLKPCEGVIAYDLGYNLDYCWDGKTLFVGDRDSNSIVHDIAHWLIAPPSGDATSRSSGLDLALTPARSSSTQSSSENTLKPKRCPCRSSASPSSFTSAWTGGGP